MRSNTQIRFTEICIMIVIITFLFNVVAKAQDNEFSEIIGILTYQKSIAEGCVKSINTKFYDKSIDLQTYNKAKHLYLFASASFNGLISRLISDVELSQNIYKIDYMDDINKAKGRSKEFITFVNDFYRGHPLIDFMNNFSIIANCLDGISKVILSNNDKKKRLIEKLNRLKWRSFDEINEKY